MSFKLDSEYTDPIEKAMADVGSIVSWSNTESYETDADGLFAALVHGIKIYVDAWAASGDAAESLAGLILNADDMEDPDRINDPHATKLTLLDLTLESLGDNVEAHITGTFGSALQEGDDDAGPGIQDA